MKAVDGLDGQRMGLEVTGKMELKDAHCTALGGAEDTAGDAVAGPAPLPKRIRERPDGTCWGLNSQIGRASCRERVSSPV